MDVQRTVKSVLGEKLKVSKSQLKDWLSRAGIEVTRPQFSGLYSVMNEQCELAGAENSLAGDDAYSLNSDVSEALRRVDLAKSDGLKNLGIDHKPYIGEFRLKCPECGQYSIPYSANSVVVACKAEHGCGVELPLARLFISESSDSSVSRARLTSIGMYLSELSGVPVLGYKPLNNGFKGEGAMLPLIVKLCRKSAQEHWYPLQLAANEFGLSPSTLASARLGFYPSSETMMSQLNGLGLTDLLPAEFGWLSDVSNDTNPMTNLAVCFLKSLSGTVPIIWGYRPEDMRRKGEVNDLYVVGRSWQPDSLYLLDIMSNDQVVLVDGFMHALALRQAGFNAVAAPFIGLLDYTVWRLLADRGCTRIVAGMVRDDKAERRLADMDTAKHGITLDWIESTSNVEQMIERVRQKLF